MAAFVEEVDKTALRPLQKQGFLCGADCCDRARTQEELQAWWAVLRGYHHVHYHFRVIQSSNWLSSVCSCDSCQAPTTEAQNYVNKVLQDFSVRSLHANTS